MNTETIITPENVLDLMSEYAEQGDPKSKAAAWWMVYTFCKQNGMDKKKLNLENPTGVQMVIKFIQDLVQNQKEDHVK